ncbi:MAG: glycosyltransferase family 2 protein [bacterium]|nr:glycosyltransferase family 2 protein [bacterium]
MKLSFVIPAYNEEKYIRKCLESVVKQTSKWSDIEIIVVNNASSDKTKEIALSFTGVKVVDEPKKGLVRARQAGYKASTGELIANIDADAEVPDDWIKKIYDKFSADKNIVALSGPYIFYDLPPLINFSTKIFYGLGYVIHRAIHFIFRKGGMIQGGNFVLRRDALDKAGGFNVDEIEFYGEDTDIALRMQKVGKILFSFDFKMYTSGRRLSKEGVLTMGLRYAINHFWTLVFKKPYTKDYIDIR